MSAPTPTVSAELRSILSTLRLGQMTDTLPERLATARECSMPHVDFLEMVLADEVASFVVAHPLPAGGKTVEQILERLAVNVAFGEREGAGLATTLAEALGLPSQ